MGTHSLTDMAEGLQAAPWVWGHSRYKTDDTPHTLAPLTARLGSGQQPAVTTQSYKDSTGVNSTPWAQGDSPLSSQCSSAPSGNRQGFGNNHFTSNLIQQCSDTDLTHYFASLKHKVLHGNKSWYLYDYAAFYIFICVIIK